MGWSGAGLAGGWAAKATHLGRAIPTSPTAETGLLLWVHADDTPDDTGGSLWWRDRTDNNYDLVQPAGASYPALSDTSYPGNKPGITFDGIDDSLFTFGIEVGEAVSGNNRAVSIFSRVAITSASDAEDTIWGFGLTSSDVPTFFFRTNTDRTLVLFRRDDANVSVVLTTTQTLTLGQAYYITVIFTGTTATIYIDGVVTSVNAAAMSVGSASLNSLSVGALRRTLVDGFSNAVHAEHLVYDHAVSGSALTDLHSYLAAENA